MPSSEYSFRLRNSLTGATPDPAYAYDGDQRLVKLTENGTVKNYYLISTLLNTTVADLTPTGAMDKGYVVSPSGSRVASLKDNEVTFINNEPLSEDTYSFKTDKTNVERKMFDPEGQIPANPGYNGGGPCGSTCPGYFPPSNGGYGGEQAAHDLAFNQRWQDSVFWNLGAYIAAHIVVGINPPAGWSPYNDNLYRISNGNAFTPPWAWGDQDQDWRNIRWNQERPALSGLSFALQHTRLTQTREPNAYPLGKLLNDAAEIIKNATGKCAKLLGKDAFARFQELKKQFEYDPKNLNVPSTSVARTYEDSGNVYLNPWDYVFNPDSRSIVPIPKDSSKADRKFYERRNAIPEFWAKEIRDAGVSEYSYAVGAILHEFLHQIGKFDPHTVGTDESVKDQRKVVEECIKGNEPK